MKRLLAVALILLIIIQFFRPEKNRMTGPFPNDIGGKYPVPLQVKNILQKACNDCHSNNTVYPWYSHIQPVAWWLRHHITEGKGELNFNEFGNYRPGRQYRKLEEIKEQVDRNDMPLTSYTLIHKDAKLSDDEKSLLTSWVDSVRSIIRSKYPADSLVAWRDKP